MPKRSTLTTAASPESGDRHNNNNNNNNNNCICNSPSDDPVVVLHRRLKGRNRSLDMTLLPPPPPTNTTSAAATVNPQQKQQQQQLPSASLLSSSSSWDEHDILSQHPPHPPTQPLPPPKKRVNHYHTDDWLWWVPTTPVPYAAATMLVPNKLPATPAFIQKRNQRIVRNHPHRNLHHHHQHGSSSSICSNSHGTNTFAVFTTTTTPVPTTECHNDLAIPPPLLLDDDDQNDGDGDDPPPPPQSSPTTGPHRPPTSPRRKSKRSFGTCTTTASSSTMMDSTTTNNNLEEWTSYHNHHHNNRTLTHDDDDDDDDENHTDHHSVDTNDTSPTATKNFRFTSFPASLPRIHPATTCGHPPTTVRKGAAKDNDNDDHVPHRRGPEYHPHHHSSHNNNNNNNNNDSHNTSLSSWNHPPDPHDGFPSDDDEADVGRYGQNGNTTTLHPTLGIPTPRARLNFNMVASSLSPSSSNYDVDMMLITEDTSSSSMMYHPSAPDPPLEQQQQDLAVSTHRIRRPPMKILAPTIPPAARTLSTRGLLLGSTGADADNNHNCISPRMNYEHVTGNDVIRKGDPTNPSNRSYNAGIIPDLQFQLDAAQCSPIPGIPEEGDDVETTCSHGRRRRQTPNSRRLRRVTNTTTGGSEGSSSYGSSHGQGTSARDRTQQQQQQQQLRQQPPPTTASSTTSSQESSTITTTSQMTARPMPDRNAFDDLDATRQYHHPYRHSNNYCDQYNANPNDASRMSTSSISSSNSTTVHVNHEAAAVDLPPPVPLSPKLICPPTPVRIHPIFRAGHSMNGEDDDDDIDNEREPHHQYVTSTSFYPRPHYLPQHARQKLERSNSLIATKLIATCSPQLLLQNTIMHDGGNARTTETAINNVEHSVHDTALKVKAKNAAKGRRHHNLDSDFSLRASYPSQKTTTTVASAVVDAAVVTTAMTGEYLSNQPQEQQGTAISLTNNFDVVSTLGSGTFADVYKVISKTDHRTYAIKRNRRQFRSKRDREVLLSEVRCMQRLQSQMTLAPHSQENDDDPSSAANASDYSIYLLFFYQAWQEDGHIFCQTELCCRDTCRELIDTIQHWYPSTSSNKFPTIAASWMLPPSPNDSASSGLSQTTATGYNSHNRKTSGSDGRVIPEHVIWKICHDICAGLSFIHSSKVGLVHNDVKPSNILFVKHQLYGAICKIGDFGMARDVGSSEDGQEGDQKYMALEMLENGTSYPSADIFSLGLTLYEMASHIHIAIPPDGHRWHELRSGMTNMNDFPTDRSSELIDLIRRMMDPKPIYRPSADDVLSLSIINDAGKTQNTFLRDYIGDVEFCEVQEEEWMTQGVNKSNNNNMNCLPPSDEQTPRNASIRPLYSPPVNAKIPPLPFAILPTPTATTAAAAQR